MRHKLSPFMSNPVSSRFIQCYEKLREEAIVPSARQFALTLQCHPQAWHKILKGERDVTIELVRKAIEVYNLNPEFLFTGHGESIINTDKSEEPVRGMVRIPLVRHDQKKQYVKHETGRDDLNIFDLITIPYKHNTEKELRAFEFKGNYLRPCLMDGDIIVCRRVLIEEAQRWVRSGFIYCFLTKDEILISRVMDCLPDKEHIALSYPGPDQHQHLLLNIQSVREIWSITYKLSGDVPSPDNIRYSTDKKISNIGKLLEQQSETITSLNVTVEKLLKQNRSLRI